MHRSRRPLVLALTLTLPLTVLAAVACKPSPSSSPDQPEPSSSSPDQPEPSALPSETLSEALISTTSVVRAIDHETREVTLEGPDGALLTFFAGDEVRNLDQVKVGDEVTVEYYKSVAYEVKKADAGAVGSTVEAGAATAAPGDMPAAAEYRVTAVTSTIASIDKAKGTVVLEDADGKQTEIEVRDPAKLDQVAVGDLVEITLTEAVAVSVTPAGND